MFYATRFFSISFLSCFLISCGGSDSSTEAPNTTPPAAITDTTFTLGISDAPVDNADEVVITIESITFTRDGDDVVFDTFSNESEGIVDAETVMLDLLQFQGSAQFNILENATIPIDNYNQVIINVLDEDSTLSYVTELDGSIKSIKVPSDNLKLGGIAITGDSENQQFTVEFNLRKSMTYKPGKEEYNLKPTGVRIVNNDETGIIAGNVDLDAINTDINCMAGTHLIYLYQGTDLDMSLLADTFDSENTDNGAPDSAISPFDAVTPTLDIDTNNYTYEFGFVPTGEYTLAYACNTSENGDDPDFYDEIIVPNPASEIIEIEVEGNETTNQNFPISD
ncbi:DUF4382 domain-containing protein [Colwelliaceae bacterium 6441]